MTPLRPIDYAGHVPQDPGPAGAAPTIGALPPILPGGPVIDQPPAPTAAEVGELGRRIRVLERLAQHQAKQIESLVRILEGQ